MFALLLGAAAVYLALGDLKEAVVLLLFASTSVSITIIQETRTERVLESLRDLTSPRALVIRDGVERRIPGREVVRGDIVVLAEGDRVPADALLLSAHDLQIDESLLTGESVPVRKTAGRRARPDAAARPGGDDLPFVFSGTLVVRGHGQAAVTATGARSEIGKIGLAITRIETEPPQLRRQTRRLVRSLRDRQPRRQRAGRVLYGLLRGSWLDALLSGIALSMSMLPEEFPLVLTVFMVMGARRISRARVLTRRVAAIETLGAATVLCTDKTGTLTQNRMTIAELRSAGAGWQAGDGGRLPDALRRSSTTASSPARRAVRPDGEGLSCARRERLPPPRQDRALKWEYGLRPGSAGGDAGVGGRRIGPAAGRRQRRPRGHRRALPAAMPAPAPRWPPRSTRWPPRHAGARRRGRLCNGERRGRHRRGISRLSSLALWGLPIRCARPFPRRCATAVSRASGSS